MFPRPLTIYVLPKSFFDSLFDMAMCLIIYIAALVSIRTCGDFGHDLVIPPYTYTFPYWLCMAAIYVSIDVK